jgi:hypothetical protein
MKKRDISFIMLDLTSIAIALGFIVLGIYIKRGGHIPTAKWVTPVGIVYVFLVAGSFSWLVVRVGKFSPVLELYQWFAPTYVGQKRAIMHRFVFVGGVLILVLFVKMLILRFE